MTKYSNGSVYERKLKNDLLERGATLVIRSAGSKSKADLVVFTRKDITLVQVKSTFEKTLSYAKEIEAFRKVKVPKNVLKVFAIYWKNNPKRDKQGWEFIEVE